MLGLQQSRADKKNLFLIVLVCLVFLIQPVYSSSKRCQSISLDDSGIPFSILNTQRASPNFCNLSGITYKPTPGNRRVTNACWSDHKLVSFVQHNLYNQFEFANISVITWIWTQIWTQRVTLPLGYPPLSVLS